jgi:hypothetical protein
MKTASTRQLKHALKQIAISDATTESLDAEQDTVTAKTREWNATLARQLEQQLTIKGVECEYSVNKVYGEGYTVVFTTRKRAE